MRPAIEARIDSVKPGWRPARFDVGEVERLTEICAGRFAWTDTPRQFHRRRW